MSNVKVFRLSLESILYKIALTTFIAIKYLNKSSIKKQFISLLPTAQTKTERKKRNIVSNIKKV